ncbi:MAG: hypothetical protein IPG10_05555 [Flavobacteriales bacterium]|jgi:hypothetical protein|nr:hypothetical protein [Flavobacteriales bacterium]MBK6754891.1 hypothetical protein [Flavobacteriales bacterium]MBK7083998.1 hypothetical protein [Flavobacteriales bacterium]MBK7270306.1 hypothetical protein [Flavobacteriales bacterium]MBK7753145.1 hypothetical protein [Flavobacteriales bacterium]
MRSRSGRKWYVVFAVAMHIAMLAAYTAPEEWVPARVRLWSQAYVRPVFHQTWGLFAPDPPLCSCELRVLLGPSVSRPLAGSHDPFLVRRMALQMGHYLGGTRPLPDTLVVDERMEGAMRGLVRDTGGTELGLGFQAVQYCVDDVARPEHRPGRIVPIRFRSP